VKVSGISVYPTQVEDVLNSHPEVALSCAIGVPDPHKLQRIKAFVVLKEKERASAQLQKDLEEHCKKNLNSWSCPREIVFRADLPMTLVGKVAYTLLEQEEAGRQGAAAPGTT
jgi:long-chain acyl-CoA synthetase